MTPLARTIGGLALGSVTAKVIGLMSRLQGHGATGAKKLQSRRSFTRNATLGAAGIVALELAGGTVYLLWPNKTGAFGGDITVPSGSVPQVNGAPYRVVDGKFYLVRTEDGVEALYWKCVHLGCTVPWNEGRHEFICPCHGSVYAYNGERISGPAPRSMDVMPVTVEDNGNVVVNTNPSVLKQRVLYTPADTTPYDQ